MVWHVTRKILGPFGVISAVGVVLGALCFVAALTPSLVPREGLVQGVLAGASFAAGYGIGVMCVWLWRFFHLPSLPEAALGRVYYSALVFTAGAVIWSLASSGGWQNDLHLLMGMEEVDTVRPFTVAGAAIVVAGILLALGRLFWLAAGLVTRRVGQFMPQRMAVLCGLVAAYFLFSFIGNDLIVRQAFKFFDESYAQLNRFISTNAAPVEMPWRSGSTQSLIARETLGAEGARFVDEVPLAEEIEAVMGEPAQEPLRIYVGMAADNSPQARAQLALQEALRVGAFERSALVIATPTGTGWMDPAGHLPLDMLLRGDVATVGVQYSYLPSWLSLLAVPEYGQETAREVFLAFHEYWRKLPKDTRPKLYLFGLSLGALNSDLSSDFYDLVTDPYDGAFWVGPPFASRSWTQITHDRDAGSPAWLPKFRDGAVVRFMSGQDGPTGDAEWGRSRMLYLQYASDPIVFFSPSMLWSKPDWMQVPRGPDVSDRLLWVPLVTFLQVGFDVMLATTTPTGHGHVYAAEDYLRGWEALLDTTLEAQSRERLLELFARKNI